MKDIKTTKTDEGTIYEVKNKKLRIAQHGKDVFFIEKEMFLPIIDGNCLGNFIRAILCHKKNKNEKFWIFFNSKPFPTEEEARKAIEDYAKYPIIL